MNEAAVRDVTDETFETQVLARSHQLPVLVDFWAPWCGPCRMLGPVLERLAPQVADRVDIVRLNTDEHQRAPSRYQVSGIPAVKLFIGGEVVAEFVGAKPEAQVRAFLDQHCPSELDRLAVEGAAALERGELDVAERALRQVLEARPEHPAALVALARVCYARGELDEALVRAGRVSPRADEYEVAQQLSALVALARQGAAGLAATEAAARAAPENLQARFEYAAALLAASSWRPALDELLTIVEQDRRWSQEAARKAMLVVFAVLGAQAPLSQEFRRKLAVLL